MAKYKLFLSGGTGFFGKWLLRHISNANRDTTIYEVVVLSRMPEVFKENNPGLSSAAWLSFLKGDILDFVFPAGRFTHVIHAATDTSVEAARNPLLLMDSIVGGTRRMLDFALASKAEKFLLTSSGAVYGPQPDGLDRIAETYSGAPSTSDFNGTYGQSKRLAEQLCTIYHQQHGINAAIARCFAFVGEGLPLDKHFAIGNFIHDALYAPAIMVKGDGTPLRSYLYGADLAAWLIAILERGKPAYPYNVGSDQAISIAALARKVGKLLAPDKPVLIERARPDYQARSQYIPDTFRARNELGLEVWTDLDQSILLTAKAAK